MLFCEIFQSPQNCFIIVHMGIAASDLIEYLRILTIKYDLRKYLKFLNNVTDFI